ncbi:MAG TPA: hypothetical protein PK079_17030 [Leptospiraceae bacterium]|nr:hypothetical protein [Leptospiraceae bacterium]HMX34199.1 hypothetical protein [Leptospiraceae bacterium]HMY30438.1 hypothetical protein [Leptospiraceae bacterium]HMZ66405.1 hypothetical protein [Leptospiraceae bacterium]HNA06445.1 hypothetical protein [Leptospiraceae bacterium]
MKNILILILFISFFSIHSEPNSSGNTANPSTDPNAAQPKVIDQSKIVVSVPGPGGGLGDTAWGQSFMSIRDQINKIRQNPEVKEKIEILNESKDKSLLVKRNNITYLYRFYKKPAILEKFNKSKEDEGKSSSLFSVGVYFSPVESLKLKKQVEDKYGNPSTEPQAQIPKDKFSKPDEENDSVGENQDDKKIAGAYTWSFKRADAGNSSAGSNPPPAEGANANSAPQSNKAEFIIQWVEPYNKKAFSKRMDYFSVDRTDLINIDYKDYFSARETDVLLDLVNEGVFQEKEKDKP